MSIVVTGATGFVAANVVRHFTLAGRDVLALDREPPDELARRHFGPPERWHFARVDVTDFGALEAVLAEDRIDAFVHMAALTPSPEMEARNPRPVFQVNAGGTANALELCRRLGVSRAVVTSSAAVYAPEPFGGPLPETAPLRRDRIYAVTKQMGELLVDYYAMRHGLETAAVRICAVYGPMERPTTARPIMSPIHDAVALARAGEPIRVAEAGAVRDWIQAADVARAIAALVDGPPPANRVYNLAPGRGYTLAETLDAVVAAVPGARWEVAPEAVNLPLQTGPESRRDPLDSSRLREERGFVPAFSLEAGIRDYVAWLDAAQP